MYKFTFAVLSLFRTVSRKLIALILREVDSLANLSQLEFIRQTSSLICMATNQLLLQKLAKLVVIDN